ncbi:beta-lactamase family protein [candidate division KSB1 bacterium]|nr:beta-lactamase family protein [candidate division KSB1 bacterium]
MKTISKNFFAIGLVVFAVASGALAQENKLPDTPTGKIVAAYLSAFNSGEANKMQAFQSEHFAQAVLQRRTNEERRQMYERIYGDLGALELYRVTETADRAITIQTQSQKGEAAEFRFEFEPQPPYKITGIRVELMPAEALAENDNTKLPATAAELLVQAKAYLEEQARADEFSGAVLIARNGNILLQEAYGFASREHEAPNRIDTKFNLGSINKAFTQIAICQLMQQGQLAPSDLLGKHLPDYPNREVAQKVTIHHLLTHRSGLGDFFNEKFENTPKDRIRTLQDYLALFVDEPLLFAPGTQQRYSNGGYIVLGLIIEKISGQNYFDYVREHVYQPANMSNTGSYELDAVVPNLATGYSRNARATANGERTKNIYTKPARGSSAGGGYSTLADMHNFGLSLLDNKLLNSTYTAWLLNGFESPQPVPQANANVRREGGYGIAGGAPGINAVMEIDFETGYTIIVLANDDPPTAQRVNRKLLSWIQKVKN